MRKVDPIALGNDLFRYVDISSVDASRKAVVAANLVACRSAPSRARQLLATGDVLVSTVRPNLNAVAHIDQSLNSAIGSTGFCVLRADTAQLDDRYLFHWVRSPEFVSSLVAQATGISYPAVTDKVVKNSQIPLPPMEEQRRIAAVLDAADALRAKRRETIAKLDTLTQSIFIDMFGDPIRNERKWPWLRLGEVCRSVQIGPFGSLLHQSEYVEGGIPIVNPMHIVRGRIRPEPNQTISRSKHAGLRPYWLEPGDIVMGRRGEMGRVAVVAEGEAGFLCGSGSLFLRLDSERAVPGYLASALSSASGRRHLEKVAQGVTMLNLNSDIVSGLPLAVPPIDRQREFVRAVARIERIQSDQRAAVQQLDNLFVSLQQRAFRSEL